MVQSLRALEIATGMALVRAPDKAKELLKPLGIITKLPTAREIPGLHDLIR